MFEIYDLTCNGLRSPAGIDRRPSFAWKMRSDRNAVYQTGCRIEVRKDGNCVWDSGWMELEQNSGILYQGEALESGRRYQWMAECADNHGEKAVSGWSDFIMGVCEPDFWDIKWIEGTDDRKPVQDETDSGAVFSGRVKSLEHPEEQLNPPIYMRKEFTVKKPLKNAVIFATAHGVYELMLDGESVSPLYAPEYTAYFGHLEYQTVDVTARLKEGPHALGCILADGWYTGKIGLMGIGNQYGESNAFAMKMALEYEDGSVEYIRTDESFRWNYGAYLYADLFVGEYVVMDRYTADFARPGYSDADWKEVRSLEFKADILRGRTAEPVEVIKVIRPSLLRTPAGEWVLDAGENIVGFTAVSLISPADTEIGLEHSEVLDKEGNFLQNIMGQHKNQKDRLICRKGQRVSYRPRFTFHGFRYVRITGLEEVKEEDYTVYVVGSGLHRTGTFRCSDPDLNQLQENIYRSQQGNMLAIPTDCPQRERAGWTGDMQIYAATAAFNMDVLNFLKRWLYDMRLEQLEDGQIPNVIPTLDSNKYIDGEGKKHICSAGWGDACVIVPYRLYQAYGDITVLEENFGMMQKWMDFIRTEADENGLWRQGFHFGDWLIPSIMAEYHDPMQTAICTREETACAMYAYTTDMMINICNALGRTQEAAEYMALNAKIRRSFSDAYISEDGTMRLPLQGLYVLALQMNLVEERKKKGVVRNLVKLIHDAGDCLDTGFLSVPFLLDTLCACGEKKLAYTLLMQKKPPSWLYAVTMGATTVWENWMAILPDGTRTNSSYNHFAFGCVGDFMYRKIGGLQIEEAGYKKVRVEPDFDCGLTSSDLSFESPYGLIHIQWEKKKEQTRLRITLPPGTSGSVRLDGKYMEIDNGYHEFTVI